MSWGTLTVGSMTLSETHTADDKVNANTGGRSVALTGQEMTFGKLTLDQLRAKAEDLVLLMDRVLPVRFSRKIDRNGYYRVVDAGAITTHWEGEGSYFTWNLSLELVGPDNAVDIESRLTHIVRANDFSLPGVRWHAPAVGAFGYAVGTTSPSILNRDSEDGVVKTYLSIPSLNARWACPVEGFMAGRARVSVNGIERLGTRITIPDGATWELSNGLVRVSWVEGSMRVSAWDGTADVWRDKDWGVLVSSTELVDSVDQVTITRNRPELAAVRLVRQVSTGGVIYVDLLLRRGSRFVEGYVQRTTAANQLGVRLNTAEAMTTNPGYVVATSADPNGQRAIAGSARTFSAHANGGVVKATSRTMDFFVGVVPAIPSAGDTAADLVQQYMAVPNEQTGVIAR